MSTSAYLDRVEAALCSAGAPPKQIHDRVGVDSLGSVRHALRELCRQGRARFEGQPTKRLYFACNPKKG